MRRKRFFIFLFLSFYCLTGYAQDKNNAKFGDITEKDFANKAYSIDSNAEAVVIADIGASRIEGNNKMWFSLIFKRYTRIRILNKNGYDAASIGIPLYKTDNNGGGMQIDKIKAITYNLEDGKVVETKLDPKNIFKENFNSNWVFEKFTLPNVKEGSIIEYEYTITSDFLENLNPWEFQGRYPVLWSEFTLSLPEFLGYVFQTQGYKSYNINERKERKESYRVMDTHTAGASELYEFTANVTDYHWVIKDVSALKEESFTSTINNHITKLEFQLSELRPPLTLVTQNKMGSWPLLSKTLMESDLFGQQLNKDNAWLSDIINPITKTTDNLLEKAKKIFAFVRDHFTSLNDGYVFMDQSLRSVAKSQKGSIPDINLLLTAMLKHEDIQADPVILSTRSNGYTYDIYPILSKFNYVICRAIIGDKTYYLDASEPGLGFGFLPLKCYNGHARVIGKQTQALELTPDSVSEQKFTSVFIVNDEKGKTVGNVVQTPGYYESGEIRSLIKEKGQDPFFKTVKKGFGAEIEISNPHIDSLDQYDYPLGISYDFDVKEDWGDIIYLNPMFGEGYKENPFKSAQRAYPVEMPDVKDETYNLQMEVPQGYELDELPKPMIVKLNDQDDGIFEYRISESGGQISLRSRIRFKRSYYLPDEYETLREFYNLIVKKQNEQIVFKKKK